MKKLFVKFLVLTVAVFLSVLLIAPAPVFAQTLVSIEVTPADSLIPALGQTQQFTATGTYSDDTTQDITDQVAWSSTNPSVVTINTTGLATGVSEGGAGINATLSGVSGGTGVEVGKPSLWVDVGQPGEPTGFSLWAQGCSGLSWALDVTGPTSYSNSGTIPSNEWNPYYMVTLSGGDYTADFSVGGVVQDTKSFTVWEHKAWMDIAVGYAGEATTFTLNATTCSGKDAYFELWRHIVEGDYWELDYEEYIPIDSNDWSYSITRTLPKGDYWAGFSINNGREDGKEFSVVDRGVPQPPVEEKPVPEKIERKERIGRRGPAINEKPLSDYDKTNSGFSTLFYNRLLRRAPEQEGLDAWVAGLESGAITGADLVNRFIFGEECQATISDYTDSEFITFLYKALFNREPGTEGYNAWLARMSAGMTREEVVNSFTHSEEFVNLCKEFGIVPYKGYTDTKE